MGLREEAQESGFGKGLPCFCDGETPPTLEGVAETLAFGDGGVRRTDSVGCAHLSLSFPPWGFSIH